MSEPLDAHLTLAGLPLALTSRTFPRLVILAVVIGFVAVMLAGGAALWAVMRDQELTTALARSHQIRTEIGEVLVLVERGESAKRGYLLTRDPIVFETYRSTIESIPRDLNHVAELGAGDPRLQSQLQALRAMVDERAGAWQASIDNLRAADPAASARAMRSIRALIAEMASDSNQRLLVQTRQQQRSVHYLYLALGLAAPLLVLVAVGSTFVIVRYTRNLDHSGRALLALNGNLEVLVRARTADLERANDEIQRFAYIVSHDLRSPLVNIMGFTSELERAMEPMTALIDKVEAAAPELLDPAAVSAVRDEIPEAVGFIRTSTQKMDRLINAILGLSRSGRRQLRPEPLEMRRLIADVVATLRTRAEAAGAVIEVKNPLPGIVSDRLAVEQVFANLVENAIKYLKPDRPGRIEIGAKRVGDRIDFTVSDNGRGIDPRDQERIFELFRRAGAQDQPGEGIGLANVRALVYRLGGFISCESALDQGAAFRVSLPAVLTDVREMAA